MATIAEKVNSLTGLSVGGTNVADNTELQQWILDGIHDVANKIILLSPQSKEWFGKWAYNESAASGTEIPSGQVIQVMRQTGDGTTTDYVRCKKIKRHQSGKAKDPESMMYATKHNPVWFFEESSNKHTKVVVLPATSNTDGEKYDVEYVHYSSTDVAGAALAHNSTLETSRIAYFPSHLQYLVILYVSIKVLYNYIMTEFKSVSELFARDALDDDSASASTEAESFLYWLNQEDVEMIQATQIAQGSEAQFLGAYMSTLAALKGEYGEAFGMASAAKQQQAGAGGRRG